MSELKSRESFYFYFYFFFQVCISCIINNIVYSNYSTRRRIRRGDEKVECICCEIQYCNEKREFNIIGSVII